MYSVNKKKKNKTAKIEIKDDIGYKFSPKRKCKKKDLQVDAIVVVKPSLISKIIKRKIKYRLDKYLQIILDNLDGNNDTDSQKSLIDLKKYHKFIKEKYSIYLDKKYMNLLNKRILLIERELANNIVFDNIKEQEIEEHKRRR